MAINGLVYSTVSSHVGNANVLVKATVGEREPSPAKIAYILHFKNQTVILVWYHLRTASPARDLFSRYPVLRTTVWDVEVAELSTVTVEQIACHFAELHAVTAEVYTSYTRLNNSVQVRERRSVKRFLSSKALLPTDLMSQVQVCIAQLRSS
jgi:hypothetical protein